MPKYVTENSNLPYVSVSVAWTAQNVLTIKANHCLQSKISEMSERVKNVRKQIKCVIEGKTVDRVLLP